MLKRILQIISLLFVVFIVFVVSKQSWLTELKSANIGQILHMIQDNEIQALLFIFLLMIMQNLFALIPLPIIIGLTTVAASDPIFLFIWAWGASLLGATLSFYLARFWLHKWAMSKMNIDFKQKIEKSGFQIVLLLRVLPFIPTSLINYSAGVSSVRYLPYIVATAIGNFIYFIVLHFIAKQLIEVSNDDGIMILIALLLVGVFLAYKYLKRKK